MTQSPVNAGEILDGKYRIEAFLGRGAMGVVVRATQLALERTVAVKFLLNSSKGEAELRFLREARIAAKLKSQHAAKVIDVGLHQGAPFIVMEYLDGEDLAAALRRAGPMEIERAVMFVLQACEALAEAHASGIVHRDVKPANMMLTMGAGGMPCVKLLDFGVSKAVGAFGLAGTEEAALTRTSTPIGSPLYMAPEQINDAAHVDGRADIWSLGVVLYQLLTDATPWTANSVMALFSRMAMYPPTPITDYRPDVPAGLAAIIAQCLDRDPSRRWPKVAAFAAALAPYAPPSMGGYVERMGDMQRTHVEPSRPTEPMPAIWQSLASRERIPSQTDERRAPVPTSDTISGAAQARTSSASTTGFAAPSRGVRPIAIGVPVAVVLGAAILVGRWVTRPLPASPTSVAAPSEPVDGLAPGVPSTRVEPRAEPSAIDTGSSAAVRVPDAAASTSAIPGRAVDPAAATQVPKPTSVAPHPLKIPLQAPPVAQPTSTKSSIPGGPRE